MTEEKLVNAVVRSLNILETLADEEEGLGITEISQRLGLAESTTHRLMRTLHHKGYVVQDEKTENYQLGLKILSLYSSLQDNLSFRKAAQKHTQGRAYKVGKTVHHLVRDE